MVSNDVHAILIKVAGIGLEAKHLGKTLVQMQPTLLKLVCRMVPSLLYRLTLGAERRIRVAYLRGRRRVRDIDTGLCCFQIPYNSVRHLERFSVSTSRMLPGPKRRP
jgi:hypothetical protein